MQTKTFEIRDAGTFIPVMAVKLEPGCEADRYLLARAGYGREPASQARYVMLVRLVGGMVSAQYDPHEWGLAMGRTMLVAHEHILAHFDELASGDVVDVEHILGLSAGPKTSERGAE